MYLLLHIFLIGKHTQAVSLHPPKELRENLIQCRQSGER